jgi:hypothetical protein
MGYQTDDAIYALQVSSNNLEHACTYLLSNPGSSYTSRGEMMGGGGNIFS